MTQEHVQGKSKQEDLRERSKQGDRLGKRKEQSKKQKFYVVWIGRVPGIYGSWAECVAQVGGYTAARFKSFRTRAEAEAAYVRRPGEFAFWDMAPKRVRSLTAEECAVIGEPEPGAIVVDGACCTATGEIEYQGVEVRTGRLLFRQGPLVDGTSNVAEFLAIVHGLAWCTRHGLVCPVYSDSQIAIKWVRTRQVLTGMQRREANVEVFELIDRAVEWLGLHDYKNKVLKWETWAWGENPADFGRK
jgi:ribonuclease HI